MFSRPLVPALCAITTGILIGHHIPIDTDLPIFLLPLIILLFMGMIIFIPLSGTTFWLIALFILIGVNDQLSKPSLSDVPQVIDNHERVIIEGTIYRPPKIRFHTADFPIHAEKIFFSNKVMKVKMNLLVKMYRYVGNLKIGQRIRFPTKLRQFKNFNNPGNFDYRFFMNSRGLSFIAIVSNGDYVVPMGKGDLGCVGTIVEKARGPLRTFFREKLSKTTRHIFTALILGERQGLTSKIREPFDKAGVSHIMAVSGLHLGLVAWLFFACIRRLLSLSYRLTLMTEIKPFAAALTTVPVIAYALLTGLHISTQRAMIMILVFLFSFIIGREKDIWSSFSLAALIILAFNGDALFTVSFQLSFAAVAGILWLAPLLFSQLTNRCSDKKYLNKSRIVHSVFIYIAGLIAVTTAATIMTMPLIAHHFHRFSVVALPANLTVVPIIGLWVIPCGLLSSFALLFSSTLAGLIISFGEIGLNLAISLVQFWSNISWSSIWFIQPSWPEITLLYGLLFLSINFMRLRRHQLLLLFFITLLCIDSGWWMYHVWYNKNLRVTILDAGKGDVALIRFPGKERMLITRNAFGTKGLNLGKIVVAPYLWHNKIKRIDYLFLSDNQAYQTERLQFIIHTFHPKELFTSLPTKKLIRDVTIKTDQRKRVMVGYQGWSFLFQDQRVIIENKKKRRGTQWPKFFITTKSSNKSSSSFPIINVCQTGALTITIDTEGNLTMKSFLKKNLHINEVTNGNTS
jgi:competence protein ComEC